MAISKEILNNKKKKANQPEPLGTVPANNPDHVSAPIDFHHPIPPKPILYNSFNEAIGVCEQIFLKPGEAHTEFYQEGGIIHCVVGIGNYNPGYKHLYLTDSGNTASISDLLNAMSELVILMGKKVDNVYDTLIEKFDTLQETVNEDIAELNSEFNDLSTNVNNLLASMQITINQTVEKVTNISEKVDDISAYVDGFDERIQQNADNITDLSTRIEEIENWKPTIDNSINQLENNVILIDSSINKLEDLINEFEPIDTSNIRLLFHDDIWTVNLCCYTAAGHIEVFDNCGGINVSGGTNTRVAECTPFNEYKTYVEGDDVSFKAVTNEGYKFICWYYGDGENIEEFSVDPIINLEFEKSDIPVIGTLGENVNPSEPAILLNGYTAFFEKMHELKWDFYVHSNTNLHPIEYIDDALKVKVTEKNGSVREYIIDLTFTGKVYFDDGAKVEIQALPSEEGHHTFDWYTLNNSTERIFNNPLVITNVDSDIILDAYFKEWWVIVQTVPEPDSAAQIIVDEGSDTYHLHGTDLHISIVNIQEGYHFVKWRDTSISDTELKLYIYQNLTDETIILHVDAFVSSGEFNLIGGLQHD